LEKLEIFDTKRAYCNLATTSKENTHRNANFGLHRLGKECQKNVMGFPYHGRRTEDSCTTPSRHPVYILEMNIKVNWTCTEKKHDIQLWCCTRYSTHLKKYVISHPVDQLNCHDFGIHHLCKCFITVPFRFFFGHVFKYLYDIESRVDVEVSNQRRIELQTWINQ
jgi:hypothetical protein